MTENATERSTVTETIEESDRNRNLDSKTTTSPTESKDVPSEDKTITESTVNTQNPTEKEATTAEPNGQSNKGRKKMKIPKSSKYSNAATRAASTKQQTSSDGDYFENEEI